MGGERGGKGMKYEREGRGEMRGKGRGEVRETKKTGEVRRTQCIHVCKHTLFCMSTSALYFRSS